MSILPSNLTTPATTDEHIRSILGDYKNDVKSIKEVSLEIEKIYKNEFTSSGTRKVYARYGITKSGKILIDFKKNGRPISLSMNECHKLNNILSSRNFENYISSNQNIIEERDQEYFNNLSKPSGEAVAEKGEYGYIPL
jgi:L-lactate utilization protein LutC